LYHINFKVFQSILNKLLYPR